MHDAPDENVSGSQLAGAATSCPSPAPSDAAVQQPVAEICDGWTLRFVGAAPIAQVVAAHGLQIGSKLYSLPTAPAGAREAPNGDWLWIKLMDWCAKRKVHPGDYNDLFAIVGEARAPLVDRLALSDEQLLQVFDKNNPADAVTLRMHAEGAHVETLDLIGARHEWRKFQESARAIEAEHGITLAEPKP